MLLYTVQNFDTLENFFNCTLISGVTICRTCKLAILISEKWNIKTELTERSIWYFLCVIYYFIYFGFVSAEADQHDTIEPQVWLFQLERSFSPIEVSLRWHDVAGIMFICLSEFGILWVGLFCYESIVCRMIRMFYGSLFWN